MAIGLTPAREAAKATGKIPIVVAFASDLVGSGLVASLARPGGNVTGMTALARELDAKRLQLVTEALPGVSRVALLFNPTKGALAAAAQTKSAAGPLGIKIQEAHVRGPDEFVGAFAAMAGGRAGAVIMLVGRVTGAHRRRFIALATAQNLPTMCWRPAMVRDGCLMSYGADRGHMVHRAAAYVAKILKGANPAELPVEQPTRFDLAINLKTAKTLGVTFPPSILLRATEVVE